MTKLISLVEQKNAEGFRSAVEAALAEKVADVLDGLKPIVAQNFFARISEDAEGSQSGDLSDKEENLSNTTEPGPGKGQAPGAKGGFKSGNLKVSVMPGTSLTVDPKLPGQGDHPQKTLASESVKKVKGGYENIGKTGKKHGVFKSKSAAEKQKAAMFANGFKG
jgi:hypothetical protein